MQGIIVTPSGDVWVLGVEKRQLVHFPKGDLTEGRIVCEGDSAEPCKSFLGPFHLLVVAQGVRPRRNCVLPAPSQDAEVARLSRELASREAQEVT